MVIKVRRIAAREASRAHIGAATCLIQSLFRKKMQRVGTNELAHFCLVHSGAEQLVVSARINAVVARMRVFGAGNQQVHLAGSRVAQHFNNLPRCGAAHNRV